MIVYGETNQDASVVYDGSAISPEYCVVYVAGGSAVYLGNGWFITAKHLNITSFSSITQNGISSTVTYVDSTLNSKYGVDLQMFYVDDLSRFDYLESANISADVYDSISKTTYSYITTWPFGPFGGVEYELKCNSGTGLTLVGYGYGRSSESGLYDETVNSDETRGVARSGTATLLGYTTLKDAECFVTMAEAIDGSAQAQSGDSGGGMFHLYGDEWYLVGVAINVSISDSMAVFGSLYDAELVYGEDGVSVSVDTSNLTKNSYTYAVSLKAYMDDISKIIETPIPEPSTCAAIAGTLVLCFAIYCRRNRVV